jgi:alkyl sulfatase BDS1-like metallo-beta-lactamase superfamily hydrolase
MFPAKRNEVAAEILGLCGRDQLLARARTLKDTGQLRPALAIAEMALDAKASDADAVALNAEILDAMAAVERSFIARNFFIAAARELRARLKAS